MFFLKTRENVKYQQIYKKKDINYFKIHLENIRFLSALKKTYGTAKGVDYPWKALGNSAAFLSTEKRSYFHLFQGIKFYFGIDLSVYLSFLLLFFFFWCVRVCVVIVFFECVRNDGMKARLLINFDLWYNYINRFIIIGISIFYHYLALFIFLTDTYLEIR